MQILKSASKIVFVVMTLALVAGLFTNKIEPKDFMMLASMVFTFYFSNKGEATSSEPFLGK